MKYFEVEKKEIIYKTYKVKADSYSEAVDLVCDTSENSLDQNVKLVKTVIYDTEIIAQ
tara:strand:+ start:2880 stop:3053 length:174 start_codon:yes stop_codon:yes gene_type:complete